MTEMPDQHSHRDPAPTEEPLDAANQSLADALRSSFSVLKAIMAVLVVLYLISNVRRIEPFEEAIVLRLGRLSSVVTRPGLVWAFPFPIDEIVPLPTRRSNELRLNCHTFYRTADEATKPLSFFTRSLDSGLDPVRDFALLTADAGLVHTEWAVTYKFDDLGAFVSDIAGDRIEAAEELIKTYIESVGVEVASEMTAEEMIRTRVNDAQAEMKRRVNERLAGVKAGILVTNVAMVDQTAPISVRDAFDATQRAENAKQQTISGAQKDRTRILNEAAGAAYSKLEEVFAAIDAASPTDAGLPQLRAQLDRILEQEVEGEAGRRIKEAGTFRASVVSQMQSDVERYRALLPEYQRNPQMLINRLWEATKLQVFNNDGVTKFYRPPGLMEFRIRIPLDPEQTRQEETKRLEAESSGVEKLTPRKIVPVGPEFD